MLALKTEMHDMRVESLGRVDESAREVADVTIDGLNGFSHVLKDTVYGDIVTSGSVELPLAGDIAGFEHCEGVVFESFPADADVHEGIGVIIGSGDAWTWSRGERRFGAVDHPIAVHTSFGWGLLGPKKSAGTKTVCCHHISSEFIQRRERGEDELAEMADRFSEEGKRRKKAQLRMLQQVSFFFLFYVFEGEG